MAYNYNFDKNVCWFRSKCPNYNNPEECYRGCINYMVMDYLCYTSQIPKAMQQPDNLKLVPIEADMTAFKRLAEIKDNIYSWVNGGYNLLIHSAQCGNGKTTWAIKIMLNYFTKLLNGNGFRCRGVFINVISFIIRNKRAISVKDPELDDLIENLRESDLVIWDDVGANDLSKYEYDLLMDILDYRLANKRANIFTSNANKEEMMNNLGQRFTSRILDSEVIEITGPDERGKRIWSNCKSSTK